MNHEARAFLWVILALLAFLAAVFVDQGWEYAVLGAGVFTACAVFEWMRHMRVQSKLTP